MAETVLLEMSGAVERVVYRNEKNQYTVLELNTGEELVTVVGAFPYVSEGEALHVFGTWNNHSTFGDQFKAQTFEHSRPATVSAMLKYLSSGAVKGIGKSTANKIVQAFGDQALEVIENDPVRLSQIRGITQEKALQISAEIRQVYGIRDLMAFLGAFGVRPEQTVGVWKRFGEASMNCIQEDPYSICDDELEISFEIADIIAQSMEKSMDNGARLMAGVQYVLRHNLNNGHTCLPKDKLVSAAAHMLGVPLPIVEETVQQMCNEFMLIHRHFGDRDFLFLSKQYHGETYITERMKMMLRYPPQSITGVEEEIAAIEQARGIIYAPTQQEAIHAALQKGILILTGGPGTGKTTTLNAIIQILKEKGEKVLLAAPTGRAAKRMSELTGEEAKTIHRLLQVEWDEQDHPVFQRNERNPLECDCIVIDELSMVDSYVFESMLKAMPMSARMILVGDSDQLPSVGAGNILGDLIASQLFSTVQLKEIFRQSMDSLIVMNAHKIVSGALPDLSRRDSDFFYMPCTQRKTAADLVVSLCSRRLPASYGYSSVSDIQVLCPGRKGALGTVELNKLLREAINPAEPDKQEVKINGVLFRKGDKVMQIKNDYDLIWQKDDGTSGEGVFNGDMGVIIDIDKPAAVLRVLVDDRVVLYDFERAYAELEPAYAVTVHKSQGNEFTAVIIPVLDTVPQLCYRNLLYTAITRAKNLLILIGSREKIAAMIENNRKTRRYTGLAYLLLESSEHN